MHMGLYYPYMHFRSDAWLKLSALYMPKMARMMPDRYPVRDSETVKVLAGELDFILDIDPAPAVPETAALFQKVVRKHTDELKERYGVWYDDMIAGTDPELLDWFDPHVGGFRVVPDWRERSGLLYMGAPYTPYASELGPTSPKSINRKAVALTGLCQSQVGNPLTRSLHKAHLAIDRPEFRPWLGVHPNLAWVYTCALADTLARRNQLTPVTDQATTHMFQPQWTVATATDALLQPRGSATRADITGVIGALAVQLVVPNDLDDLPVRKIVDIRKRYGADFLAFAEAVETTSRDVAEFLAEVHERAAFEAYLEDIVQRTFTQKLEALRNDLRQMNINHGFSAASFKFSLPAAAISAGAGLWAENPPLAGAGAVGFGLLSLRHALKSARRSVLAPSPASYLLQVERGLTPQTLLGRMADGLANIAGLRP